VFPAGQPHDDENFGKVEIYRDSVAVRLPILSGGAATVRLNTVSQGCADLGICYPPQAVEILIADSSGALPAQSRASNVDRSAPGLQPAAAAGQG
jgi:thiol:disulfide interchange protein DsbD